MEGFIRECLYVENTHIENNIMVTLSELTIHFAMQNYYIHFI